MRRDRSAAWLLVVLGTLLAFASTASAHAVLVGADPPPNSRVDAAPTRLHLIFSEPLEKAYTSVQVIGPDGADHAVATDIDPDARSEVTVPLDPPLADGLYTVKWRTLSADTHTVQGQYLLAVNVPLGAALPDGAAQEAARGGRTQWHDLIDHHAAEVGTRLLGFAAALVAAGIPAALLVLRPLPGPGPRRALVLATFAGAVAAAAALLLLALFAARIGTDLAGAASTHSGQRIAARALVFLVATGVLAAAWRRIPVDQPLRRGLLAAAAVAGALGLLAASLTSHAAAEPTLRLLALALDVTHLLAAAFWIGGLALLLCVLPKSDLGETAALVRRFSPAAIGAVLVLVVTGTLASGLRLLSPRDLLTSVYGQALLVKILLLLPLAALGAYNRYVLHPRIVADTPASTRAGRALHASVGAEVTLMAVVLAAAAVLATVAPPDTYGDPFGAPSGQPRGVVVSFEDEGYAGFVRVLPLPVVVGEQNLTAILERVEDDAADVRDVFVVIRPPDDPDGEGTLHRLDDLGGGRFAVSGFLFTSPGTWHNNLIVQGSGLFLDVHFIVQVG